MKKIVISIFVSISLLLFQFKVNAVNYPDSLRKALFIHKSDTSQILTLVNLGYYFVGEGKSDSALIFYKRACLLSEKISDPKFRGLPFYQLGRFYGNAGEYGQAIKYYYTALKMYKNSNRYNKIGGAHNGIGINYYYSGQYDSALVHYSMAVPCFEKVKDIISIGQCYNNIGIVLDVKGEREKSVQSYLKAVKIYEDNNREDLITGPYENIALVYITQKQFPQALSNLDIAKKIAIKYKDEETLIRILNAIGTCYDEMNRSAEGNTVFNEALELARKIGDKSLVAITLTNLGENYLCMKKFTEGEKILLECVELKKQLNNEVSLGIAQLALGQAYLKNKKQLLAINSFNEGLEKVKKADYKEYIKVGLEGLAASYAQLSDYKKAYFSLDEFVKLNDSLLTEASKKIVTELQTKYETDKKEAEIKLLSKDKALQDEEIKRRKTEFRMVLGISAIGLILLIYVFISLRNKRKANLILEEKNYEIRIQKDIVEEKQKEILDSINYAKRIQDSWLPTEKYIERNVNKAKKK